jgi:hypothetical protein
MKQDYDITVNDVSFVFIDTMFWFDVQKDKELHKRFKKWISEEKYEPIFHSNLLLELFHSSKTFDFDALWDIIKDYCFSNFCPIMLIEEEIHMTYSQGEVVIKGFLKDAVFKLSESNKEKFKKEYLQNSQYFRIYKEKKGTIKEAYLKGLNKLNSSTIKGTVRDILNNIKNESIEKIDSKFPDILKVIIRDHIKQNDNKKYNITDQTDKLVDSFMDEKQSEMTISNIRNLVDSGFYKNEEILDVKIEDYLFAIQYLEVLKMTFENSYQPHLWIDFIEKLRECKLKDFQGYYILTEVSNLIRSSSAKLKISDTVDFLNLSYLPYCSLYVSDAHIIDSIKQVDKTYNSRVMSLREFKEKLN